jgi:hypothetical protein
MGVTIAGGLIAGTWSMFLVSCRVDKYYNKKLFWLLLSQPLQFL